MHLKTKIVLLLGLINTYFIIYSNDLVFNHITIDNGLSDNYIEDIIKDNYGFMWFALANGLAKYDGTRIEIYKNDISDNKSLGDNQIYTLYIDTENRLWIGTKTGLYVYNYQKDNFIIASDVYASLKVLNETTLRAILEDTHGNYWFGTRHDGLFYFNVKANTVSKYHSIDKSFISKKIMTLIQDSNEFVWIGSGMGLSRFEYNTKKFEHFRFRDELPDENLINDIEIKDKNHLWIATKTDHIFEFDIKNKQFIIPNYLKKINKRIKVSNVLTIKKDKFNFLWIGSKDGLLKYNLTTSNSLLYNHDPFNLFSLSDNDIYKIYFDDIGSIWIGTRYGGVNYCDINRKKIFSYPFQYDNFGSQSISSITCDKNETIWVGTYTRGLYYIDTLNDILVRENIHNLKQKLITTTHIDKKERFWVSSHNGIYLYNRQLKSVEKIPISPQFEYPGYFNVHHIFEDKENNIWLATQPASILYFNEKEGKFVTPDFILEHNDFRLQRATTAFHIDNKGNYWIGFRLGGAVFVEKENKKIHRFNTGEINNKLLSNSTNCFFEDKKGNIWIGTDYGISIFSYYRKNTITITEKEGLLDNTIAFITQDNNGYFWISSNLGITRYNPEDSTFLKLRLAHIYETNQYNRLAGFFNTKENKIFLGGINGLNSFYANEIKINKYIPKVLIHKINISSPKEKYQKKIMLPNKIKTQNSIITLNHLQNTFSVEYVSLSYTNSKQIEYSYALKSSKEKDTVWNSVANQKVASFNRLPSGNYIFMVKAANSDGIWTEKPTILKFEIIPPIWKTTWAYIIYIVIISLIVTIILRLIWRVRIEKMEKERINMLDLMKVRFYTNISHELKTPLTLIKTPIDKMLSDKKFDLNLMKIVANNTNLLYKLINQLLDFRKIETGNLKLNITYGNISRYVGNITKSFINMANDKKIHLTFDSTPNEIYTSFDPDIIEKVMYNLISNAIKFTQEKGNIKVNCWKDKINKDNGQTKSKYLYIAVKDNGIGIPEEYVDHIFERFYRVESDVQHKYAGSGVGLSLAKELIELHKGQIALESNYNTENHGSLFTITLPCENEYKNEKRVLPIKNNKKKLQKYNFKKQADDKHIILIVEDNKEIRLVLDDVLNTSFEVIMAENGVKGWEKAVEIIPDIIISDIIMPEMDGWQLCKKVKTDERTNHIPVILLTALSSGEQQVKGIKAGADEYIPKPFRIDLLLAKINTILENRKKIHEKFNQAGLKKLTKISNNPEHNEFLHKLINIIETNMDDPEFDVDSIVKLSNLGRTVLYNKLKNLTGKPVNEFIQIIRLQKAAKLLKEDSFNISQVAYQVGFNDSRYFATCFKKYFKKTPSEFIQS